LPELGQGWVAEEALAIAVLCALAAETSSEAIVAAVNHDGDSDSTGAITGNIVGTMRGADSLRQEWLDRVEMRDLIETLAADFAAVLAGRERSQPLRTRYPGW
jgi:ADP-ribosylglycohydrolase